MTRIGSVSPPGEVRREQFGAGDRFGLGSGIAGPRQPGVDTQQARRPGPPTRVMPTVAATRKPAVAPQIRRCGATCRWRPGAGPPGRGINGQNSRTPHHKPAAAGERTAKNTAATIRPDAACRPRLQVPASREQQRQQGEHHRGITGHDRRGRGAHRCAQRAAGGSGSWRNSSRYRDISRSA